MSQPFTRHIWTGKSIYLDVPPGPQSVIFEEDGPITNCTLLRTLVWGHFQAYGVYGIGSGAKPNVPTGFALGDINSNNYNGNPPTEDPGNQYTDLIATGSTVLEYTGLGWPPNSTAHLTGSVNTIVSDAQLDTVENVNTFMYGSKTIFVDSNAQRSFNEQPQFKITELFWGDSILLATEVYLQFQIRMLWQQRT